MKKIFLSLILTAVFSAPAQASIYKNAHRHHTRVHHHWRTALHHQKRVVKLGPETLRASPNERLAFKYEKLQRVALNHHARHSKVGIN